MSRDAERAHAMRFYGVVAIGVTALVAGVVLHGRWRETPKRAPDPPADPGAIVEWCASGLEAIPGGGCFSAPAARPTRGLVVYLHGRYAPESVAEELERQTRVARLATARGYAALALRGMQGECTDPQLVTWWCWPSNEKNAGDGPTFTTRWRNALDEAEKRAGKSRRLLIGFSSGGYFASMIASRALSPFDGVVVAHAGPVEPMHPAGVMAPMLLIDADDDPSSPEVLRLDGDLMHEGWPHSMVIREGGHALPEWDVEMALTFFDRIRTEKVPLAPPLAPVRAPHPHDAGGEEQESGSGSGSGSESGSEGDAGGSAPALEPAAATVVPAPSSDPAPVLDPAP